MSLSAAYGGEKWSPRTNDMRADMREQWGDWGSGSEVGRLRAVLLRRPGSELDNIQDFDAVQMRADLNPDLARSQHDAMADLYEANGVAVHYVENTRDDKPNQMFIRDLLLMTPEGAIITRPASTVRAGEERFVAEALGRAGVPILMSVHGSGTFEGADCLWVDDDLCFLAEGLRTNTAGADQVERMLREIGVKEVVRVQLAWGAMHLDGVLALASTDVAVVWPYRTPSPVVRKLQERGFRIVEVVEEEAHGLMPMNFVALEPGKIMMPKGGVKSAERYAAAGLEVLEVDISELMKAGGGVHCMTGFLKRDKV